MFLLKKEETGEKGDLCWPVGGKAVAAASCVFEVSKCIDPFGEIESGCRHVVNRHQEEEAIGAV
ncbi:hypothetical protein EYF80_032801 [Liparis tanakae]|uniref:Uncharacterized protein n=1 Tax=Liparis tanakae TaxID=230148 RepID=A0A4Z2GUR8_9TELE|nr:hypothetical protein EYF80_032801 [Liparis tanakae]